MDSFLKTSEFLLQLRIEAIHSGIIDLSSDRQKTSCYQCAAQQQVNISAEDGFEAEKSKSFKKTIHGSLTRKCNFSKVMVDPVILLCCFLKSGS